MSVTAVTRSLVNFIAATTVAQPESKPATAPGPSGFTPSKDQPEKTSPAPAATVPPPALEKATPILEGFHAMEAYYSWDGKKIIFQGAEKPNHETPLQAYVWTIPPEGEKGEAPQPITHSQYNCECTFFSADGKYVIYNTNPSPKGQPIKEVDFGGYPYNYDLGKETFLGIVKPNGTIMTERLTNNDAYEAETSFSPLFKGHPGYAKDGTYLLFTSSRSGSLDLYIRRILDENGARVAEDETTQVTNTPTLQEGGAFFMPDGRIVYRAWEYDPKNPEKEKWEKDHENFRPMHLFVWDPTTKASTQLTQGNVRDWAPFPHPGGKKVVFAKRDFSQANSNFDIYVLELDTGKQERITDDPHFDGYPVFHPNGQTIMFSRYFREEHRFQLMQVPYKSK